MTFVIILIILPYLIALVLFNQFKYSRGGWNKGLKRKDMKFSKESKFWLLLSVVIMGLFVYIFLYKRNDVSILLILSYSFLLTFYKYLRLNRK